MLNTKLASMYTNLDLLNPSRKKKNSFNLIKKAAEKTIAIAIAHITCTLLPYVADNWS